MKWTKEILPGGWTEYTGNGGGKIRFFNGKFASANPPPAFHETSDTEHAMAIREIGERGEPLHSNTEGLERRHSDVVGEVLDDHPLVALRLLEALHRGDPGPFRSIAEAIRKRKKEVDALKVIDSVAALAHAGDESGLASKGYKNACIALGSETGRDIDRSILIYAIGGAARKCGGVPTVEMVADSYESIRVPRYQGLIYSGDPRGGETIGATTGGVPRRDKVTTKKKAAMVINGKVISGRDDGQKRLETLKANLKKIGFGWLPHRTRGDTLKRK